MDKLIYKIKYKYIIEAKQNKKKKKIWGDNISIVEMVRLPFFPWKFLKLKTKKSRKWKKLKINYAFANYKKKYFKNLSFLYLINKMRKKSSDNFWIYIKFV